MKISLASDHAGFEMKKELMQWLKLKGYQVLDFGAFSVDPVDYPDYAYPAAESVAAGIALIGVLICGSGTGMAITANKVPGIRAANCNDAKLAVLSRKHNNTNVLTFGARIIDTEAAKKILEAFLETDFEGGRHMVRVEKIHSITGW